MKVNFTSQTYLFGASLALCLSSCTQGPPSDSGLTNVSVVQTALSDKDSAAADAVERIFVAIPSPIETAGMLRTAGADYHGKFLNDVRNGKKYNSAQAQALNLGIFGADLSYTSIYNQNQESIIYLSCTKQIADKLGLDKAFGDETIERMEANIDNRDSLVSIISETYYELDAYLKENKRDHVSAWVIAGGWIEALYLSTQVAKITDNNHEIVVRIAEQKIILNDLLTMVNAYNKNGELDALREDLNSLDVLFEKVHTTRMEGDPNSDAIGKKVDYAMSGGTLEAITAQVEQLRNNYISI